MTVRVEALTGESDLNFILSLNELEPGSQIIENYVLKLTEIGSNIDLNEFEYTGPVFQNAVLNHLNGSHFSRSLPHVCRTQRGDEYFRLRIGEKKYIGRVLTYVPGKIFAQVNPHSPGLLNDIGKSIAELDLKLFDFKHSGAMRYLKWDLKNSLWIRDDLDEVPLKADREHLKKWIDLYTSTVIPVLPQLKQSVIHNDANDYNILVKSDLQLGQQTCAGFIDFGDCVYTQTIHELAIAAPYLMFNKPDPLQAAGHLISGYHSVFPLTEAELSVLFPMIGMRLCVSVVTSAIQKRKFPDNTHLTISEKSAWDLLRQLSQVHPEFAHASFRNACSLPPLPTSKKCAEWVKKNRRQFGGLFQKDLRSTKIKVFDFSPSSPIVDKLMPQSDPVKDPVAECLAIEGADVGIGRYHEARLVYQGDSYLSRGNDGVESRTIHLGIDFFLSAGEKIRAPLDGRIHSFQNNAGAFDYGPTIILQHDIEEDNLTFYTLYGHLSADSLAGLKVGQFVKKGQEFAEVGTKLENGGWSPHLHFQIIDHLFGNSGNFPGVAKASEKSLWLGLCPDPNSILNLPDDLVLDSNRDPEDLLRIRKRKIGKNVRLSYQRPLKIVRGRMQYLYDQDGKRYLDAVNNVSHVGHCHPRVLQAAQDQMAVLNTNTRYLHDKLVQYSEALLAKFPAPLDVCYFVCSGSEANELALRLARTYTRNKGMMVIDGAYHGNTNALIEISPYKFDGPGGLGKPDFVYRLPVPDLYRGPFKISDFAEGQKYPNEVGRLIQKAESEKYPVSAFIGESILSCGGQIVLPKGYLKQIYGQVRNAGGVCIADEVQTGFGRVGSHFWGFETQEVIPDIVTLGKSIGNGHPLAAVITTSKIAETFDNGMEYFNTFGGNPVSCAIGLSVLEVIQAEGLQEKSQKVGEYLREKLHLLSQKFPILGDIRGLGLFIGLEFVLNRSTLEPAPNQTQYVVNRMKDRGILLSTDGPFRNVIKIKPPLQMNQDDADFLVDQLGVVLAEDLSQI